MSKPSSIEVWGGKAVGDKAGMLIEHESLITEHGMQIPPTVVLASESVGHLVKRSLPTEEDFANPKPSPLAGKISSILERFSDVPAIAVRSSAAGDARGSGIYKSCIVPPERKAFNGALWDVGDSFKDHVALNFRTQLGLGDEFAIMIQPVIGQLLDAGDRAPYGPALSGTAYSSTPAHSGGIVNVVAGFGAGVDRQGAERITFEDLEELSGPLLQRYLDIARWHSFGSPHGEPDKNKPITLAELVHARAQAQLEGRLHGISDFRDTKQMLSSYDPDVSLRGLVFSGKRLDKGFIQKNDYDFDEVKKEVIKIPTPLLTAMRNFEPGVFLETLQTMEQDAGYPLYVEWASTVVGGSVIPWVVQIAPVERTAYQELQAPEFEQLYYRANTVTGFGDKTATKVVKCMNPRDIEHLRAYNSDPKNDGYVLIYRSHLTTSLAGHGENIFFSDCDRASVILEIQNVKHGGASPAEHLLGAVDLTDKFFGVINSEKMEDSMYDAFEALPKEKWQAPGNESSLGGLSVHQGDFTIVADELNDQLFLGKSIK